MFRAMKLVFAILNEKQKLRLYKIQLMIILMSFFEVFGLLIIIPFLRIVSDPTVILQNDVLAYFYNLTGLTSNNSFIIFFGLSVLFFLAISATSSVLGTKKIAQFSADVGVDVADVLYENHLNKPWIKHFDENSSKIINLISTETNRFSMGIVLPILQVIGKMTLVFVMLIFLFLYDPYVAILGSVLFITSYCSVYYFVRGRLLSNSSKITLSYESRVKLVSEAVGGIKDVILMNRRSRFVKSFNLHGRTLSESLSNNQIYSLIPRYLVEFLAFGSVVIFVLFSFLKMDAGIEQILPTLTIYAFAAFKILPSLQAVYQGISSVRGHSHTLHSICDLLGERRYHFEESNIDCSMPIGELCLQGVYYKYPQKDNYVLHDINMIIPRGATIGFVGPSGSGKSTLVDIVLGLLIPASGSLLNDGVSIDTRNVVSYRSRIGYVPQSIYLADKSILENIAFGIEPDEIDLKRIDTAIDLANLKDLIDSLPSGHGTIVGERGVQLSGGQVQRIGIARALYNEVEMLVFDEATSALDSISENKIMETIYNLSGSKTIIMIAHRISTVKNCDIIYYLDKGVLVDSGSYSSLVSSNPNFARMASLS